MKVEIARLDKVFDTYNKERPSDEEVEGEYDFKSSAVFLPYPFRQMRLYFSSNERFYSGFISIESAGENVFRGLSKNISRIFSKYDSGLEWISANNNCKGYVVERGSSFPILSESGDRIDEGALRIVGIGDFGAELRRFTTQEDFYNRMSLVGKVSEIIINLGLRSKRRRFPDLTLTVSCI